ncbi:hypothetical protein AQUCO_00200864v1 [Aquilegia coerulea]|uniref:NAC domain-containing protein n=1 Tax=Aquilegia coerulea TaxID=218851 RepID=A0A2G5F563_AQUCA|nr:hypothetical protein AQUCO_00200864v1 [Aquilegia coerulea]
MNNTSSLRVKVDTSTSIQASAGIEAVVAHTTTDVILDEDEKYLRSFPPGYRFAPGDDELLEHYLMNKIGNRKLPINRIKDVNIYKFNPQDLVEKFKIYGEREKVWYFFTPRDRKYPKGNRPNRAADRIIFSKTQTKIGCRKALVFYSGKPPKGRKTKWIMHEYRIEGESPRSRMGLHDMRLDDYVLCRIHEKVVSVGDKTKATKAVTNKKKKNVRKKKNDKPLDPSNSNPVSALESNDNPLSSVDSVDDLIVDADGRDHLMAMCEGMGISDPYSEYFENPYSDFQSVESVFNMDNKYYSTYQAPTYFKDESYQTNVEKYSQFNQKRSMDFTRGENVLNFPPLSPLDM